MYRIEFQINELPLTTNRMMSMHWTKKGEYVKEWHQKIWAVVGANKPRKPLQKAKLTLTWFGSREPDFDGLVSAFKPVLDGLIKCGVIVDDKPSNIGKSNYLFEKAKRVEAKIKVIVEEV